MKIRDLLENLVQPKLQDKQYRGNFSGAGYNNKNRRKEVIGSGSFSTVKNDKTDPHLVRKHTDYHHKDIPDAYPLAISAASVPSPNFFGS